MCTFYIHNNNKSTSVSYIWARQDFVSNKILGAPCLSEVPLGAAWYSRSAPRALKERLENYLGSAFDMESNLAYEIHFVNYRTNVCIVIPKVFSLH